MLDDRTTTRTDIDTRNHSLWSQKSNRFAWSTYLGDAVAGPDVSPYAAAARREELTGLPPAWIGVGNTGLVKAREMYAVIAHHLWQASR